MPPLPRLSADGTVSDIHRDVAKTRIIVSEVRRYVTDTHTMVSDIHRTIVKSQEGSDGKNMLVIDTRALSITERSLTVA